MKNYLVSIFFLIGVFNVYAQEKVITAPGSYSFSTSFSFGQPSAELKKYYNKDFLSLSSLVKYRTDGKMDYRKDRLFSTDSSVTTYSYNDNGQLAKIEQKLLLSGTIIYLKEYFYNANNQLVKSTLNADTDAYIEEEILFEYDASGNVIKEVTFYPKYTGRKKIVLKEYNENKNVISESVDENSDGIFEKTLIVKFDTYNRQVYFNESNKNGQRMLITNKYIGPTIVITTSNYQNKDTFPYSIFRKTIDAKGITVLEESIRLLTIRR
ncbi:MAG: hypothetical protein PSX81_00325 [bacterium]|nr:hypothetical protein [bacterium]